MFRSLQGRIAAAYVLLLAVTLAALAAYLTETLGLQPLLTPGEIAALVTRAALWAFVAAALVGIVLASLVALVVTRPLRRLSALADRIARGDLRDVANISAPDEIGTLAAAIGAMARGVAENVQSLETERARLEAVLAHMTDGVLIAGADGRVLLINATAAQMLRVSAEESRGRTLIEVLRDHELVGLARRGLDASLSLPPEVVEVGQPRRFVQAVATRLPDAPPRVLLVLHDVTDLRQAEIIRREFVANVSHELRTPLTSLRALLEVLEDGGLDDRQVAREFLGRMQVEVDGLTQLIQELLELARLESGRTMQPVPLDLGAVTAQAVERMRAQAERQHVALQMAKPGRLPPVLADRASIEQVIINLLHNAVKFTPPHGHIVVSAIAAADGVRVSVADTGIGIASDDLPRIFERFYKADKSRASGGTGLGLAIAKHTIQAHGGRIWAESAGPSRGAVFTIELPYAPQPAAA